MSSHDPEFDRLRAELRRASSPANWSLWLDKLALRERTTDTLVLEAPDNVRTWVSSRFGRLLRTAAASVLGPEIRVELVAAGAPGPPAAVPARRTGRATHPRLCFEQFVVGAGNQLAHTAALHVAENPGLAYNPLFLYGEPGLGKTHLLQSVATFCERHGGWTVRLTSGEEFTSAFTRAVRSGDLDAFKADYREVDVLLVDDVQFLQEKVRTEEEFFHTFNAVHETGAQIVLSSDRPPHDLAATDERLRARYGAGLVVGLEAPDMPTRRTILRKRIADDGIADVEPEAIEAIAARVRANVRTLEGALIRVVAFASLTGRAVTAELADEVLADLYPDRPSGGAPTVAQIQAAVGEALGVSHEALVSSSRVAAVAWARQVAMYIARELTPESLPAIGKAFGRNHTTVMHAVRRTTERMEADPDASAVVHNLCTRLRG